MEKYDRESNVRKFNGIPRQIIRYLLVIFTLYCMYIVFIATWETRIERASFVGGLVFLAYLMYPAGRFKVKRMNYIPWYDVILAAVAALSYFYFVFNCDQIINQGIRLTTFEIILGVCGILVTLEACRRCVGLPIVVVAGAFIVFALTQKPFAINVYNLFYTTDGVIGIPIRACLAFIVLFVIFGSFLEQTGISQFFIDLANSIAGSTAGGPAKVAVISSALCGMVSGSSVGNTVTTGSITIPLMKKNGYHPNFAGAVEAASSTGGQIMPPIMGAAAFLMVEYTGFEYGAIALRAILPAALYFTGIFTVVHLEAKKLGLKGISREQLPRFFKLVVSRGYLLLPLVLLVILIVRKTMAMAAIIATALAIIVSFFRKETRLNVTKFFDALENAGKNILTVGIACAVAGIIACVITTTGIGTKLISLVLRASGGYKLPALLLTMVTCIILGMGVPTTANYVIMAMTCAPILVSLDIPIIAAHMFVFYFGIVADITPPVALAAYAGAAISKGNPMRTGLNATKLAIAAFIVPYIFALNPAMLFVDTNAMEVILIVVTSFVGIFAVAMGVQGFYATRMHWALRIVSIAGGLLLIYPGLLTDVIGVVIVGAIMLLQRSIARKNGSGGPLPAGGI